MGAVEPVRVLLDRPARTVGDRQVGFGDGKDHVAEGVAHCAVLGDDLGDRVEPHREAPRAATTGIDRVEPAAGEAAGGDLARSLIQELVDLAEEEDAGGGPGTDGDGDHRDRDGQAHHERQPGTEAHDVRTV